MAKCVACGKSVLLSKEVGNISLCRDCAAKINLSAWKNRDCASIDELIEHKNNALQLAKNSGFSNDAVQSIENYFDAYINAGYLTTFNGKAGQLLKLFDDFCIVETKNESKKQNILNCFCEFVDDDEDDDEEENDDKQSFLSEQKASIVKGLMSGKIVQTGVGLVTAAVINSQEKEKAEQNKPKKKPKNIEPKIIVGEHKIKLSDIASVDTYSTPDTTYGYLRFIPKGALSEDYHSCIYFFFKNSIPFESKKIRRRVDSIRDMLNEKIEKNNELEAMERAKAEYEEKMLQKAEAEKQSNQDPFEEIRKYKALLDEGIITEEDLNKKKNELLGL